VVQWSSGPVVQWSSGPVVQWSGGNGVWSAARDEGSLCRLCGLQRLGLPCSVLTVHCSMQLAPQLARRLLCTRAPRGSVHFSLSLHFRRDCPPPHTGHVGRARVWLKLAPSSSAKPAQTSPAKQTDARLMESNFNFNFASRLCCFGRPGRLDALFRFCRRALSLSRWPSRHFLLRLISA